MTKFTLFACTSCFWIAVIGLIDLRHKDEQAGWLNKEQEYLDELVIAKDMLTLIFNEKYDSNKIQLTTVKVTAYQSRYAQTDSTPWKNASGTMNLKRF